MVLHLPCVNSKSIESAPVLLRVTRVTDVTKGRRKDNACGLSLADASFKHHHRRPLPQYLLVMDVKRQPCGQM